MVFRLFKKKDSQDDLPPIPETADDLSLPALPPLPGEDDLQATEPLPKYPRFNMPEPTLPEMPTFAPQMPRVSSYHPPASTGATVFVRIDKYRDIMETMESMYAKIEELKTTLNRISAIKGKEAEIIDGWNAMLQEAKAKLAEVNAKLAKPQE